MARRFAGDCRTFYCCVTFRCGPNFRVACGKCGKCCRRTKPTLTVSSRPRTFTLISRTNLHRLTSTCTARKQHISSVTCQLLRISFLTRLPIASLPSSDDVSLWRSAACEAVCGWAGSGRAGAGAVRHLRTRRHHREGVDRKVASSPSNLTSPAFKHLSHDAPLTHSCSLNYLCCISGTRPASLSARHCTTTRPRSAHVLTSAD